MQFVQIFHFENVHRALYSILEFRKEHQLMIKLIQEERDMGTKEVQEVMQQVDVEIVSVIQSYLKIAIEKVKLANAIQKSQHLLCFAYMYRLF